MLKWILNAIKHALGSEGSLKCQKNCASNNNSRGKVSNVREALHKVA